MAAVFQINLSCCLLIYLFDFEAVPF